MILALAFLSLAVQDDGLEELETFEYLNRRTPVVRVVESASPAVVYIETDNVVRTKNWLGQIYAQEYTGSGSGVVIMKEGFVVTNYHVVKNAKRMTVSFDPSIDDKTYPATLVSFVEEEDLALLSIEGGGGEFRTVPLGTSSNLMIGEPVIAIGSPYNQTHTVSTGIISGLHRNVQISNQLKFDDLIQTDASINFGNSGGPLLNINGKLIGINTAMNQQAENIGFAIPVDRVRAVLEDQLLSPESSRAWLGFTVLPTPVSDAANAALPGGAKLLIDRVFPGGPADVAGMRANTRLLAINGEPLRSHDSYRLARLQVTPGTKVEVEVEQLGRPRTFTLQTWDKTDGILYEHLGFTAEEVRLRRGTFVRVGRVFPESPAAVLGLESGDRIDAIQPQSGDYARAWRIVSRDSLAKLISELRPGTEVKVDLYRDLNGSGSYEQRELHRGQLTVR